MAIHVFAFLKRRPGTTKEEFDKHWSTNHASIFMSMKVVKERLLRYSQYHVLAPPSEAAAAAGISIAPYDGVAEIWVEKVDDIKDIFGDEYQQVVVPDEELLLDRSAIQLMIGEDELKFTKPGSKSIGAV